MRETGGRAVVRALEDEGVPYTFGIPGTHSLGAVGSSFKTAASVSALDGPENARRPVTISYSTAPKEKMSLRASTVPPTACSGDM